MNYLLLLIFILIQVGNRAFSQVHLSNDNTYAFKDNIYLFQEPYEGRLSIKEVAGYYDRHLFRHLSNPDNNLNLGFVDHFYWIAIPIENVSDKTVNLEAGITNQGVYQLEYYFVFYPDRKVLDTKIAGKHYDFFNRPVICRHYYFPFRLSRGQQAVIFYRIDLRGNGFYTPLCLVTTAYRIQSESSGYLYYAFFFGFLTFISFFSLVTFLWTRDRVYLFYSLYVASGCLMFLADGDLDYQWLYPHWPAWATIAPSMYAGAIVVFMLFFMSDFLQLKTSHKKLFITSRTLAAIVISVMTMIPIAYDVLENMSFRRFVYYYGFTALLAGSLFPVFCIIRRIFDRYRPAYLYGAAILSIFLAAIIYILHSFDVLTTADVPFNYILLGFTIEIFVLSFALIYSFNYHKKKHRQLAESYAQQQLTFSHQLLQVQEAEKKRIAEDLHDELGGNLAAIKMNLQSLQLSNSNAEKIISLIDSASNNARSIAHNLMPPEFAKSKLKDLLYDYFKLLNTESNISFHYHTTGENGHFNKEDDLIIYRIVMEITNNITRHSKATEATIQLLYYDSCLEVMAEDNGIGFTSETTSGIGIKNIQSRVSYLNGNLNIDSNQHGTVTIIKIPYKK